MSTHLMSRCRLVVPVLVLLLATGVALAVNSSKVARAQEDPLALCREAAFSTEEDFMMQEGEPWDGDPYISDGDLLSTNGQVCARNRQLLEQFDVREDLGLDAVDILSVDERIIAFSTELDSPHGTFTAGDLLFTNGAVIPNQALVVLFQIGNDIGLDAVHFVGRTERIIEFVKIISERSPDELTGGVVQELLNEMDVDIWFSTEGTFLFTGGAPILDGDILSAGSGIVVLRQHQLLDPPIPAGISDRGVDFGLDALTGEREPNRESVLFSTEILYRGRSPFTDGDVLELGGAVVVDNATLIKPFFPAADFVGLDAFYASFEERVLDPHIQHLCGYDVELTHISGGLVPIGGPGTGLITPPPTPQMARPCGRYVPIDGLLLPEMDVVRFRVAYREVSDPVPPVGTAPGIETRWRLQVYNPITMSCTHNALNPAHYLETQGSEEWMDALQFLESFTGGDVNGDSVYHTGGCANGGMRLAVWNTLSLPAGPAAGHDREDHYVVWLEWEDSGGTLHREPFDHHLQLDNTLPGIASFPDGLQVKTIDGSGDVPACGEAPSGASQFQVWGQFEDEYYWSFELIVEGGLPPSTAVYGPHNHWDADDGTPMIKNTDATGTTPDLTTVHLRNIDLSLPAPDGLGDSFQDCCYLLRLRVYDQSIRHNFNGFAATPHTVNYSQTFITFAAG